MTYGIIGLWHTSRVGEDESLGNLTWVGVIARSGLDGTGRLMGLGLGVLTALVALWNGRRHWRSNPVGAAAIVGCASVVAAPISWPHHAVWLIVWGTCLLLSRSVALRLAGAAVLLLSLAWTPLAAIATQFGGDSVLSMVPVLAMTAAAVVRMPDAGAQVGADSSA